MPYLPPRQCKHPGCRSIAVVRTSYCEAHKVAPIPWRGNKGSSTARGYGVAWRKLRLLVLDRDSRLCQSCLAQGLVTAGNEVDHIKPKSLGGDDCLTNLQTLCYSCHKTKTLKERVNKQA